MLGVLGLIIKHLQGLKKCCLGFVLKASCSKKSSRSCQNSASNPHFPYFGRSHFGDAGSHACGGVRAPNFNASKPTTHSCYSANWVRRSLLACPIDVLELSLRFLQKRVPIISGENFFFLVFTLLHGNEEESWGPVYVG